LKVTVQTNGPVLAGLVPARSIEASNGATVSTRQLSDATELTVALFFCARTLKACTPFASGPGYVFGLTHAANAPLSSEHSKVTGDAESVNAKVADVTFVGFTGPLVMVGVGVDGAAKTDEIAMTEPATTTRAAMTATTIVVLLGAFVGRCMSIGSSLAAEWRVCAGQM
jgi:hypothetical protein